SCGCDHENGVTRQRRIGPSLVLAWHPDRTIFASDSRPTGHRSREKMRRLRGAGHALLACAAAALVAIVATGSAGAARGSDQLQKINHIVVIYEENHSFDNLYGGWEGVNGLANADAAHTTQVDETGNPFGCLMQNDVNLTSPQLSVTCND